MLSHQEDDVLGPVDLGPEELGSREQNSNASICSLMWGVRGTVGGRQYQGLCTGGFGCPKYGIDIGTSKAVVGQGVGEAELLLVHLQPQLLELGHQPGEGGMARVLLVLLQPQLLELGHQPGEGG